MINCNDIENKLVDYLDGSLAAELRGEIEEHLRECPHCRELVERFRPAFLSMTSSEIDTAPETLWRSIQNEINALDKQKKSGASPAAGWQRVVVSSLKPITIATALLFGVFLGSGFTANGSEEDFAEQYSVLFSESSQSVLTDIYFDLELNNEGGNDEN